MPSQEERAIMQLRNRRLYKYAALIIAILVAAYMFLKSIYVVPIVMYHNIDEHDRGSRLSVSPTTFERQMRFLKDARYNIVPLETLIELMRLGHPIPYNTIAVTFDDGFENNYTTAFPVLKRYNIPATIFVVVDKIGTPGYLNWQQLQEMSRHGIDIGSHTLCHAFLPEIKDPQQVRRELILSRKKIKERLPAGADTFAYCGGGFNEKVRQAVIDAGYKGACATNPGKRYPADDIYALKRLRISRTSDNLFIFWIQTNGLYTFIKEHRDED